jgi:methylmalonyl-CoA epimerase
MLKRIHHIDYLVRDIDKTLAHYNKAFGIQVEGRKKIGGTAEIAYFHIGEVLFALLTPVDPNSWLQKQLDEKGEGFVHMGCEVDDLAQAVQTMKAKDVHLVSEQPRRGLDDWNIWLIDLAEEETKGSPTIQLVGRA